MDSSYLNLECQKIRHFWPEKCDFAFFLLMVVRYRDNFGAFFIIKEL